jgi:general secretion pathway protein G
MQNLSGTDKLSRRCAARGRGFTLIEVLIVIAILLAIGGLVLVNVMGRKQQADADLQLVQFKAIDGAMDQFKLDMKRYPTEEEGLAALTNKSVIQDETEAALWRGPYLKQVITKDKWNHDLIYRNPSESLGEGAYDLISFGPDGQQGTADDILNHPKNANGDVEGATGTAADSFAPPKTGG